MTGPVYAERREIPQREQFRWEPVPELEERIARGVCPICEKARDQWPRKHHGKFCTHECRIEYLKRTLTSWEWIRYEVAEAAGYTCAACGRDCRNRRVPWKYDGTVDHIVPIALGGGEFDRANLQLLCTDCDRTKTRNDMARIAERRRWNKCVGPGQTVIPGLDTGDS
jgi:5-methylcytosine-specific restriction endonuclease McrA